MAGAHKMMLQAKGDPSLVALIAANVVALMIAYATGMSLRELMLVYWIQSVIIGICSFIRMVNLKRFDTSGFKGGSRPLRETTGDKWRIACFFVLHYGLFHFFFLIFIILFDRHAEPLAGSLLGYGLCALVFSANHGYSLARNMQRDTLGRPKISTLMILPYARVVPMHVTILLGGTLFDGAHAYALFALLKISADAAMHTVEHHVLAKGSVLPPAS